MARFKFDNIDLLIVDEIGKNISGTGCDPNVVGRNLSNTFSGILNLKKLFIRGLTPKSHHSGVGLGMADMTTRACLNDGDWEASGANEMCIRDRLIVCVMVNSQKNGRFTPEERGELIRRVVSQLPNVEVDASSILLAEYAKQRRARVIVKGLRAVSDFEAEVQMSVINRKLNPNVDTMFLPSHEKYTYLSSTVVKEMVRYGVELSDFLPREIIQDVKKKTEESRRDG